MNIKKENLCFLFGRIRKKETTPLLAINAMPFDIESIPDSDEKWNFLKDLAVNFLIENKKLPTFAKEQDYEYSELYYRLFSEMEEIAYSKQESKQIAEIKVFNNAFDKIVLPNGYREKIIEVCQQLKEGNKIFEEWGLGEKIKKGKGVNFLFTGVSGTGKTYCGEIIAEYLGTVFEVISVASLESKWAGESEKNISEIFKSLYGGNKVLILDEVDSFLTSRSQVDHIYQNKITNQFLIELERHNGIVVMTTNRPVRLDKALQRRIDLVLDFPFPDLEARKSIWKYHIPDKMPKEIIDYDKIASFGINGGQIKNCILSSARKMIVRDKKLSTDIIIEAIIDEQNETRQLTNGKDHS